LLKKFQLLEAIEVVEKIELFEEIELQILSKKILVDLPPLKSEKNLK